MTQYLSQLSLARLLAASLLLGLALGLLYDVFRIRRLAFRKKEKTSIKQVPKHRRFGSLSTLLTVLLFHIEDIFFGITAGVATAILYFALSMGQVRLMAIFGEGLGFLLYRLTLGRLIMACADAILRFLAWILHLLTRFIILPPLRLLKRLAVTLAAALNSCLAKQRDRRLFRMGNREATEYAERLERLASVGFSQSVNIKADKTRKQLSKRVKRKG